MLYITIVIKTIEDMTVAKVITAEERNSMIQSYSDFHKDAFGTRPRWINPNDLTDEELISDFDKFSRICKENSDAEEIATEQALHDFDRTIEKIIATGAKNRQEAISWLVSEETFYSPQCVELWVYQLGIYFTDEGKDLVKHVINLRFNS